MRADLYLRGGKQQTQSFESHRPADSCPVVHVPVGVHQPPLPVQLDLGVQAAGKNEIYWG